MSGVAVNRLRFHLYRRENPESLLERDSERSQRCDSPLSGPFPCLFRFFLFFFFSNFYSDSPVRLLQTSAVNFLGAELNGARERFSLFETLVPGEISTG